MIEFSAYHSYKLKKILNNSHFWTYGSKKDLSIDQNRGFFKYCSVQDTARGLIIRKESTPSRLFFKTFNLNFPIPKDLIWETPRFGRG